MANDDNPSGFLPYINLADGGGGEPKPLYLDLSSSNTEIGLGAPVASISGVIDIWSSGALIGMAAEHKAASAGGQIAVWANPLQLFVGQTDDGTGVLTAIAGVQLNATIIVGGVSNNRSTAEIDESSGLSTATLELKIIRLSNEINNAFGEFNRLVVKINNHQLQGHTGTAGT